jgi:amino acid adenylation domain-containing protein
MTSSDSIVASFEEVVSRSPELCALRWSDGAWSYAELNARANRLAHFLIEVGVRQEAAVGVFALRAPETLVAFLAILKAGGAYVALDPAYPEDRIRFYIEDAAIRLILADPKEICRLPATGAKVIPLQENPAQDQPETNPACQTGPDSAAHIFYTSGSTGRPKGVVIEHRGILRLARDLEFLKLGPGETLLQLAPLNYDVSAFEIWVTWLNGACVALPPAGLTSLHALGQSIRSFNVTSMLLASALLPLMVDQEIDSLASIRQLVIGGDIPSTTHVERFLRKYPQSRLTNAYGPTENTVITSTHPIHLENPMPARLSIGRPIQKTQVLILDEKLQPVPPGEIGEMVITGEGLARGYLNLPELTDQCFIEVVDPSGKKVRAYRSGDLGRNLPDGTLDFRGRRDDQVKINGMRIELGEIKCILQSHPEVAQAEALLVESEGKKRLETFVVPLSGMKVDERALREFLAQKIPGNWRPSAIHIIPKMPLSPSDKVDRDALLESIQSPRATEDADAESEPEDQLEKAIWNIWRDILPGRRISKSVRYSCLGGDSLSALQMIARVEKLVGRRIGLRPLLEGGTIVDIAAAARANGPATAPPLMLCTQPGAGKPPFFFAHGDYVCGGLYCQKMAPRLGADQPFYAISPQGTFGGELPSTLEEAGAAVVKLIQSVQPKGPYYLGGYCNGALVMFEAAQQLIRAGNDVTRLVMLDPPDLYLFQLRRKINQVRKVLGLSEGQGRNAYHRIAEGIELWQTYGPLRFFIEFFKRIGAWIVKLFGFFVKLDGVDSSPNLDFHYYQLLADYEPHPYPVSSPACILLRENETYRRPKQVRYWSHLIAQARFEIVPGTHLDFQSCMPEIAEVIRLALKKEA